MPPSRFHDTEHVRRAVVRHAFTDAEDWASGIEKLTQLSDADIERVALQGAVPATRAALPDVQSRMKAGKSRFAASASKSRA